MRLAPLIPLPLVAALSACVSSGEPRAGYAFIGRWNCEVGVITLTDTVLDNGHTTIPIRAVTPEGRNYTLFLATGERVGLAAVTETAMTWVSGTTGDQLTCKRL